MNISRARQFFSPRQDFSLYSLTPSEKSKIISIMGDGPGGRLSVWKPVDIFPQLSVLRANRVYIIQSSLTQSGSTQSFEPYTLGIEEGGLHPQNNYVSRIFQFFTYRSQSNFDLNNLAPSVKSKILKIYAQGSTSTGNFRTWTPNQFFPQLRFLVPGSSYLIENNSQNFVAYDLGVPEEISSSSSSSEEMNFEEISSSSSSADEMPLAFINDFLLPDMGLNP